MANLEIVQIALLKNLIREIEQKRKDRGAVVKSQKAPAHKANFYFKGVLEGYDTALSVIKAELRKLEKKIHGGRGMK